MAKGDWKNHWKPDVVVYNSYTQARFGVIASVEGNEITIKRKSGASNAKRLDLRESLDFA